MTKEVQMQCSRNYSRKPALYLTKGILRKYEVKEKRKQAFEKKQQSRRQKLAADQKAKQAEKLNTTQQVALATEKKESRKTLLYIIIGLACVCVVALAFGIYYWLI